MNKVKVPLNGQLFELVSGRQLVPGVIEKLTTEEAKDNKELLEQAVEDGLVLEVVEVKGGEK